MAEHSAATGAQRVALLARPGKAADNLAEALRQAGANLVLIADPNSLDAERLREAGAQAVLVALEPGVEQAIDRLDPVLSAPELTVIFDEADLAAHRAGWDAARWVRHLSAKLHHHERVLPPGGEAETEEWHPSPGQLPKPGTAFADLDLDTFAEEAASRAGNVPSDAIRFETFVQEAVQLTGVSPQDVPSPSASGAPAVAAMPAASSREVPAAHASAAPSAADASAAIDIGFDTFAIDDALQGDGLLTIAEDFAPNTPGVESRPSAEDATGIQPMRFDDDAFFLEELSADAGKSPPAQTLPDFEFDALAFDAPVRAAVRDQEFDSEAFDVRAVDLEAAGLDAAGFDAAGVDAAGLDAAGLDAVDLDAVDLSLETIDSEPPRPVAQTPAPSFSMDSFGGLSLVDNDAPPPAPQPRQDAFKHDLSTLESRISSLSLVDIDPPTDDAETAAPEFGRPEVFPAETSVPAVNAPERGDLEHAAAAMPPPMPVSSPASSSATMWASSEASVPSPAPAVPSPPRAVARGIVLIEAGLGGPDPVRQVLAGLPANFPMPVLVRLHLQGGRYDRLVSQMERAASLPVMLAETGQMVHAGSIYFLPDGVGLLARGDGMQFIPHPSPAATIFAALPPEDSAVIFLSGSDSALIEDAMQAADAGALLIAQSPEDCYDGAACAYLRSRGAPSALPGELARRLLSRWG